MRAAEHLAVLDLEDHAAGYTTATVSACTAVAAADLLRTLLPANAGPDTVLLVQVLAHRLEAAAGTDVRKTKR